MALKIILQIRYFNITSISHVMLMLRVSDSRLLSSYQMLNITVTSASLVDGRATVVLGCEDDGGYRHEGGSDQHVVHPHHGRDVEKEDAEEEEPDEVHPRREHRGD